VNGSDYGIAEMFSELQKDGYEAGMNLSPFVAGGERKMIEQLTAIVAVLLEERGGALVIDGMQVIEVMQSEKWKLVRFDTMQDPYMLKISLEDS
jgi:hypothetical protein